MAFARNKFFKFSIQAFVIRLKHFGILQHRFYFSRDADGTAYLLIGLLLAGTGRQDMYQKMLLSIRVKLVLVSAVVVV